MPVTVHDVISSIREQSRNNHERGSRFERLMVSYLQSDPQFSRRFTRVHRWADWPEAPSKQDHGIDLVAETVDGGYCAIQCKFYEGTHRLQKDDIDSFFTASGKEPFTQRLIVSTTDTWGRAAEEALCGQQIPVTRLGLGEIAQSPVSWDQVWPTIDTEVVLQPLPLHEPLPHQRAAVDDVLTGFARHDRGKLVMACGTGKTFTSLKIAEELAADLESKDRRHTTTRVLFLVPSIALLSQSLREWSAQCRTSMRAFAVCSDAKVGRRSSADDLQDLRSHDLALPATTDASVLLDQVKRSFSGERLQVVFSTYQSLGTVHTAQKLGLGNFDLVICDEAHRTTGVTRSGEEASSFVKVHDREYLKADRRLYMTATPRLFDDNSKSSAKSNNAVLCSMDDEEVYGPEFHRLGFGRAVEEGLLTDYKVLILNVDEAFLANALQSQLSEDGELKLDDAAKVIGCWNGLAKKIGKAPAGQSFEPGEPPMRRAVAFARTIAESKKLADKFAQVVDGVNAQADEQSRSGLRCEVEHVDGSYNALERNRLLDWLKADAGDDTCRILSNARCLSEGIDVPALDAVLFLHPRKSVVDVVQSVGRVMRRAESKKFGYIILPVGVPTDVSPAKALGDNKRYKAVWQVLQALRAHDDRFNATINKINLNRNKPDNIMVGTVTAEDFDGLRESVGGDSGQSTGEGSDSATAVVADGFQQQVLDYDWGALREAIYTRIVDKVGERHYWADWARDIAEIAERHVARIRAATADVESEKGRAFAGFVEELQANLNPGVDRDRAADMLAQHMITKPVFDALFKDYDFAGHNPVSLAMEKMLTALEDEFIGSEAETLEGFYASVRKRAEGIDNHEGRQQVITELYENFFKKALPKTAEAFGIVYTPVEIVDFILRITNQALDKHFDSNLSNEGVHVIDPFTGTGTFLVRLLQLGLIRPDDLLRKYTQELHANEIVLLAYYIAAVNIEAAFHQQWEGRGGAKNGGEKEYLPFEGIVLADTFQLSEERDTIPGTLLGANSDRARRQLEQNIRVVIGNPPYSSGQTSQNDNNQNQSYEKLDARIAETYAAGSTAQNKNSLYDSYIRAIRWASDRIEDGGVVCYVTNGGYIDGNTASGLRKSLVSEFDYIYCLNLRGNARTAGEQRRKEAGNVFGSGSRNTVAVLLLVKNGQGNGQGRLVYHSVADYLSRSEKLNIVAAGGLDTITWQEIAPSSEGDWINQRDERFRCFSPIGDRDSSRGIFAAYSRGLASGRDAWVYNFSEAKLRGNVERMIGFYNSQVDGFREYCEEKGIREPSNDDVVKFIDYDSAKISWNRADKIGVKRGRFRAFGLASVMFGTYRPFVKQRVYFSRGMNDMVYALPVVFPVSGERNFGFYNVGSGSAVPFSVLMMDALPDLHVTGAGSGGQFFPRYTYRESAGDNLFSSQDEGLQQVDNITDFALADFRKIYGSDVTKDDIFYYTYGLLHSEDYRTQFAADLKKSLPRIPKVAGFREFVDAGRNLAVLHIGYETVQPYPLERTITGPTPAPAREVYRVQKMKFADKSDRSTIVYNSRVTVSGIPERAYRYQLGARSAVEWVMDRYQVKTDEASGIVNDPNDWSDDPRYIIDLLGRIVTVSLETVDIVESLPPLEILED
ncbi:DEAD/DEAH box helicase [Nocardiopsis algeriensis]|uniref:Putative helicase n=1 Tax=Nocardiopsis algeriensis TaxID=1478215 RepID=A0A841IUR2_9ACTN|nr:putative helicase [Nocardiopsis algeriensis]